MIQRTRVIGNRKFNVKCEKSFELQADWLLELLEKTENKNGYLKNGYKIQIGWTIITLNECDNEVTVLAPDYDTNPFVNTSEDLTVSLSIQLKQNYCLNRLQLEGEAALFKDKIVVAKGAILSRKVYLERSKDAVVGDSGWYLGLVEESEQPQELEAYYVYQLLKIRPSLLQALAIPRGYLVVFNGDEIESVLNEEDIDIWQGSVT